MTKLVYIRYYIVNEIQPFKINLIEYIGIHHEQHSKLSDNKNFNIVYLYF